MSFDPSAFRQQFPLIVGSDQVYLDTAATSQKPQCVIDAITQYYCHSNSNVHRGAHQLSAAATAQYEAARDNVASFVNAQSSKEIIFTKGTTESINLVAQSYGASELTANDNIVISVSEHHANIVPWQMLCERIGCQLRAIKLNDDQTLDLVHAEQLIDQHTKIVAIAHASNVTGVINPVEQLVALARAVQAVTVIDGAQAIAHLAVDVAALDCDFYAFSGHKMYGPTGIGVLYGKQALLDAMPPWQGGGEMIKKVSLSGTTFNTLPFKFEAGTPNISGVIGLSKAIDFIKQLDLDAIHHYETALMRSVAEKLRAMDGFRILGDIEDKLAILSFYVDDEHPSDIATLLDQQNIAVRAGHHCAMPLMEHLTINGTVRISFCAYNSANDVISLIKAIEKAHSFL